MHLLLINYKVCRIWWKQTRRASSQAQLVVRQACDPVIRVSRHHRGGRRSISCTWRWSNHKKRDLSVFATPEMNEVPREVSPRWPVSIVPLLQVPHISFRAAPGFIAAKRRIHQGWSWLNHFSRPSWGLGMPGPIWLNTHSRSRACLCICALFLRRFQVQPPVCGLGGCERWFQVTEVIKAFICTSNTLWRAQKYFRKQLHVGKQIIYVLGVVSWICALGTLTLNWKENP